MAKDKPVQTEETGVSQDGSLSGRSPTNTEASLLPTKC